MPINMVALFANTANYFNGSRIESGMTEIFNHDSQ